MYVRISPPFHLPELCPTCGRSADSTRTLVLRRSRGWGQILSFLVLGVARYDRYRLEVPYCSDCNRRLRIRQILAMATVLLPGLFALVMMNVSAAREWPVPLRIAGFLSLMTALFSPVAWFCVRDGLRDVRFHDVDPQTGDVILSVRNGNYAHRLQGEVAER